VTATDGRPRTGGEHPGPADPSGPDDAGRPADLLGSPATPAARISEPDGGPAVARARARRDPLATTDTARGADTSAANTGAAESWVAETWAADTPTPSDTGAASARPPGRHARPDGAPSSGHTPPPGYRPRHAAPDAETERFAVVPGAEAATLRSVPNGRAHAPAHAAPETAGPPTPSAPDPSLIAPTPVRGLPLASTFPASGVTASESVPQSDDERAIFAWRVRDGDDADGPTPDRVRIVLAERRSPTRAVGTVAEIEAQTATGELLLSNLMRSQLTLALRLTAVAVLVLGVLPVVFLTMPAVSDAAPVLGIGLPWLLLGVLSFPFLLVLGWLYTRHAERNELDFADDVED
jgi:hypothetical protein